MTIQQAISILSQAANGHALTTGPELWEALHMGIAALVKQRVAGDDGRITALSQATPRL